MQETTQSPTVSVVVPTFNRRSSLQRLLEGLAAQSYPAAQFEVVVVDDGSTDGTAELLRDLVLPYEMRVLNQEHGGPGAARNLGVAAARGELIAFLDDDVVPARNLLREHVETHGTARDSVVIGPMSPPAASWQRPAWVRWEEDKLQTQYRDMLAGKYACTPRQFYTGNASLSRAGFLAGGGFDTTYRRAEDVELAYRLRDLGARFIFNPRADVTHYPTRSFQAWCQTPYQYGRYDVAMDRDKGHEAWRCAVREFHSRHLFTRLLAHVCVGRRVVSELALLALRASASTASRIGKDRAASLALSAIFNLRYWQGAADELGGREPVFDAIAHAQLQSVPA